MLEPAFALHRDLKDRVLHVVQKNVIVQLVVAVVAVLRVARAVAGHAGAGHVGADLVLDRVLRVSVLIAVQTAGHKDVILVFVALVVHADHAVDHVDPAVDHAVDHVVDHAVDRVHLVDVVVVAVAVVLAVLAAAVHVSLLVFPVLLTLETRRLAHSPQVPTLDSPRNVVVFSPAI